MGQRIKHRRDTAASWTSNNPVLQPGEFAWESDSNKLKIGDGVNAWNSLPYFGAASAALVEGTNCIRTIAASTATAQAHGLGGMPKLVQLILECLVANNGYTIGDFMQNFQGMQVACTHDVTNVTISQGAGAISGWPKAGGVSFTVAAPNWRLRARPFK